MFLKPCTRPDTAVLQAEEPVQARVSPGWEVFGTNSKEDLQPHQAFEAYNGFSVVIVFNLICDTTDDCHTHFDDRRCVHTQKASARLHRLHKRFQTLNRCEPVHFLCGPCPVQGRMWLEPAAPIKAADRFFVAGSPLAQVPAWQRNCITQRRRASHHGRASVCSAATSCRTGDGSSSEAGETRQLLRRCRGLTCTNCAALDGPRFVGRSFLNELAAEGRARERRYDGGSPATTITTHHETQPLPAQARDSNREACLQELALRLTAELLAVNASRPAILHLHREV